MKNKTPYIESIQYHQRVGESVWHSFFAIKLLSVPVNPMSESWRGSLGENPLMEITDLINALYFLHPPAVLAIRCVTRPNPNNFAAGTIEIGLLAKTSAFLKDDAEKAIIKLASQVTMQLGGSFPDYIWSIADHKSLFHQIWFPIDWHTAHVVEIRRRESLVKLDMIQPHRVIGFQQDEIQLPSQAADDVYFVHPFTPRAGAFERLLRTLLLYEFPIVFTATLAPVKLTVEEENSFLYEIAKCEGYRSSKQTQFQRIYEQRARILGQSLLAQLLKLQDSPFLLNVYMTSPEVIPVSLAEATGVAISAPIGQGGFENRQEPLHLQMGGFDVVYPKNHKELNKARENTHFFLHQPWGINLASPSLNRIRYLVDGHEASSAFRLPVDLGEYLPGLETHRRRLRPLPRSVSKISTEENTSLTLLGSNNYMGFQQDVYISEIDRRQHVYVVGQTGTGKTTLLKTMILSDIEAGRGLAVIDPHGDLYEEMLAQIPESRINDVVLFDPSDIDFSVGLNLLECDNEEQRHFIVREMKAIMKRLIEDLYQHRSSDFAGPVFYLHMQMNMLLAMSDKDRPGTLLQFYEIFQSRDFWKRWYPLKWKTEILERWVSEVLPRTDYVHRNNPQDPSFGEYISSKFVDFVFDPRLRLIFGQTKSTVDLREIIDEGKILLVNLAKGLLGEANAQFLGLIMMAKIQAAVMGRANQLPHERRPFFLYVDEFHSLAIENFTVLLSEARKFGLGLVLANQFMSQIKNPQIIQSVFGNVGTIISFRIGREDAEKIEPHFLPSINRGDLTNLPNWQACIKATIRGQACSPFYIQTVLSNNNTDPLIGTSVRKHSQDKYGRPRGEVEKLIKDSLLEATKSAGVND
jgi:hypothetical protein